MNPRRFAALFPVAIAFAAGSGVARLWFARAPQRFAVDLAQPLVVVTSWGNYGAVAFAILATTVAAATLYLVVVCRRLAPASERGDVAIVTLVAALAVVGAFAWPFVFSSDVYAYAAYGEMQHDGLDPYAPLPATIHSVLFDATRWQWSGSYPVCVYGPAFVAVAAAVTRVTAGHDVALQLWAMRVLAAAAFVASIPLLATTLGAWQAPRRFVALCAYGLNPAILWTVGEGHNDALLLFLVMAAGAVAARRPILAALVLGLSPLIKAPGAAIALGAGLGVAGSGRRDRAAILAALAVGLAIAAVDALPQLLEAVAASRVHGRYAPEISAQGLFGLVPSLGAAAAAAVFGVWSVARRDANGFAWLGIAQLIALPNGYPWYALWLVPWCVAAGDTWASRALWGATISSVARYLPDAAGTLGPETARLAAGVAIAPLLLAAAGLRRPIPARKKAPIIP
jgi:alpha-1,6-mannosyltransferase